MKGSRKVWDSHIENNAELEAQESPPARLFPGRNDKSSTNADRNLQASMLKAISDHEMTGDWRSSLVAGLLPDSHGKKTQPGRTIQKTGFEPIQEEPEDDYFGSQLRNDADPNLGYSQKDFETLVKPSIIKSFMAPNPDYNSSNSLKAQSAFHAAKKPAELLEVLQVRVPGQGWSKREVWLKDLRFRVLTVKETFVWIDFRYVMCEIRDIPNS